MAYPDQKFRFSRTLQCHNVYPLLDLTPGSGFTTAKEHNRFSEPGNWPFSRIAFSVLYIYDKSEE
jgi:hypothetical protein